MPKICFIADASSPHTQKWIAGCSELHWKIIVVSHRPAEIPGAEVIVYPLTLTGFPRYCWGLRRLIRKLRPDIVHAHQFGAHALYAWFSGVSPVIVSAWGSDILVKPQRSLFIRRMVIWLIPRISLITSVSAQITADLMAYGARPEQVLTFPFGINRRLYDKLSRAEKNKERLIICSPRLHEPLYNIGEIIRAFRQIRSAVADLSVELWLLGEGSLTPELQQYVSESGLTAGIRFWGRVSPQEFSERLAESDIMVSIPSSDGTPVSMHEAMAAGCLPILSDLPVYHDWVTDGVNGLILKKDRSDLADALLRGVIDKNLRLQAAAANRRIVKERAIWEERFQPMLDYYRTKAGVKGG